jgi:hypothetical protein
LVWSITFIAVFSSWLHLNQGDAFLEKGNPLALGIIIPKAGYWVLDEIHQILG